MSETKSEFKWDEKARKEATKLEEQWWEPTPEAFKEGSFTEAERRTIVGAIARKMMAGQILTPKEFEIAKLDGMWPKESFYQDYVIIMYEDDEKRGQIDGHSTPEVLAAEKAQQEKEMKEKGSTHMHFHTGLPIGEIRYDKLSLYQRIVLKHYGLLKHTIGCPEGEKA